MRKFQLRGLQSTDFAETMQLRRSIKKGKPTIVETDSDLKDWIIITYPENFRSPEQIERMRDELQKVWGPKVAFFPEQLKFFVFEEVE